MHLANKKLKSLRDFENPKGLRKTYLYFNVKRTIWLKSYQNGNDIEL